MELKHMYGRPEYDTRAIQAGAIEYVTCSTCGAGPGTPCLFQPSAKPIPDFAHIGRRFEYLEGKDIFFGAPTFIPPEVWRQCKLGRHAECKPHPADCKCVLHPEPCECSCHPKKSSADVDDLLG